MGPDGGAQTLTPRERPGHAGLAPDDLVDDATLVARARRDPEAFSLLFRRHVHDVHRFVRRRTGSDALADDLTATTFERCWRALPDFEPQRDTLRPWLLRIAANELAGHYRSETRRRRREELAASREAPHRTVPPVEPTLDEGAVLRALDELGERHQIVLSLRFLADLSTAEAAAAMQVGSRHFAVMQYRALAALRHQLERSGGGTP